MISRSTQSYAFGPFRVDSGARVLTRADDIVPLTPKAFETLFVLLERAGHVVTKEELIERVWPDAFVEPNNLAQNVSALRRALAEDAAGRIYIETVPKRGYRFVAPVTIENGEATDAVHASRAAAAGQALAAGVARLSAAPSVASAPETRYARSGDVNIAYQVVGDGPIDLVFVMGWVSHLEYFWTEPTFARFLRRLASFSRVILFDKRGTGLSDRVTVLPSLEQRMDDVRAVMDAVGSRQAALFGVSEGGPMCTLFAATYPEKTLGLITVGSYARRLRTDDYPWGPTVEEREAFYQEIQQHWGGPVGIEDRAPSRLHDPVFREWWSTYLRMGASPGAALALTKMNADIDVRHVLPTVRVPTLILHRVGDQCLTIDEARFLAGRIPGARLVELPGEDHLPFVGDQDSMLDEIEEFLTGFRDDRAQERDLVLATVACIRCDDDCLADDKAAPGSASTAADAPSLRARMLTFCMRELDRYRGRLVHQDEATLLATFDGPARAVRCASLIAEAARRLGVPFRVGLHTGQCEVLASADGLRVRGPAVDVARAVAGAADDCEVVVSRTVRDLVAGAGLSFRTHDETVDDGAGDRLTLFGVDNRHLQHSLMSY
jgi:DNA-binding winged helix-turn-helix (wHTH) protein/pimeloyl-ACP methyl ester carboxylesterase